MFVVDHMISPEAEDATQTRVKFLLKIVQIF